MSLYVIHHPEWGYLADFGQGGCRWSTDLQQAKTFYDAGKAMNVCNCFVPFQREGMTLIPVKEHRGPLIVEGGV